MNKAMIVGPRTSEEVGRLLLELNHALPAARGLSTKNIQAYARVFAGIPLEILAAAIKRTLEVWEKPTVLPTPGTIHKECLYLLARREGLPDAITAWSEVITQIQDIGTRRRIEWSHEAIGVAVRAMGGVAYLATSDSMMADRSHFIRNVYPEVQRTAGYEVIRDSLVHAMIAEPIERAQARLEASHGTPE